MYPVGSGVSRLMIGQKWRHPHERVNGPHSYLRPPDD
jgi:hypothetical protein